MHRALLIPEIAADICEILPEEDETRCRSLGMSTSKALAALARTCRSFQDPALDVLWRIQTSVINVLNCMTGQVWEWPEDGIGEVSLLRPVLPEDWERPLFYARRVKYLETSYDPRMRMLTSGFYDMLLLCLPPEPFFPNIESIEQWDANTYPVTYIRPFLGPFLTSLGVGICKSTAHLSFLASLGTLCPQIETLSIHCSPELRERLEVLSYLVKQLKHLRDLTVPCLNSEALQHVSRLASLRSVTLTNQPRIDSSIGRAAGEGDESRAPITHLSLTCTDALAAYEVLSRFEASPLQSLYIDFRRDIPANDIVELYHRITKVQQQLTLLSLFIAAGDRSRGVPAVADPVQTELYSIPATSLRPLSKFRNLTLITLSGPVGFDLDDASVAEIAREWSQVQVLEFRSSNFTHLTPRVTLRCLISFAQICPCLHRLELTLDATIVPNWEDIHGQGVEVSRTQQSKLLRLNVPDSPVGSPLAVAAFLSSVFPKLKFVESTRGYPTARLGEASRFRRQWKVGDDALPLLRSVRAEERHWAERSENTGQGSLRGGLS